MYIFFYSVALIISFFVNNGDCTTQDTEILTDEISSIYFDIEEFQKSLNDDNSSTENLLKIVKEMGSTLILMLSKLESSKSFESAFISKVQSLNNEVEKLKKDVNETECSLSTRIIDIENDISKLKEEPPKVEIEPGRALAFARRGNERKILNDTDFFVTPSLPYIHAKINCFREGGTPFIPKTKDEFHYLVERLTSAEDYGWLPLTDISQEGVAEWDDGTSYAEGPILLEFADNDELDGNSRDNDCIDVNKNGVGDWYTCTKLRSLLCLKTASA